MSDIRPPFWDDFPAIAQVYVMLTSQRIESLPLDDVETPMTKTIKAMERRMEQLSTAAVAHAD